MFDSEMVRKKRLLEHGNLARIGRMLSWLGENCETYSVRVMPPRHSIRAGDAVVIEISFRDAFEADAFRARFPARRSAALLIVG